MARRNPKSRPKPKFTITRIRKWREKRGRKLEELAAAIGITHASLSRIERGLQPYGQEILEPLARELGIDVPSLIGRDPDESESIWPYWEKADEDAREMLVDIAKRVTRTK